MGIEQQLPSVIAAVREEPGAGPRKRSVVLFDGKRLSAQPERCVYRFESPEGVFMGHVDGADINPARRQAIAGAMGDRVSSVWGAPGSGVAGERKRQ